MTRRDAAVGAEAARARFEGLFRDHHVDVVAYVRRRAPQELPWLLACGTAVVVPAGGRALTQRLDS